MTQPADHKDPRCLELHELAQRLIRCRKAEMGNRFGFTVGNIMVTSSDHETAVRINTLPAHFIYRYTRDYQAEERSTNREMGAVNVYMRGSRKIYSVTEFDPELADEAIDLIRKELVLDDLASI